MTAERICRVCHLPVGDLRPTCGSCAPLMERYRHERDTQDFRRGWGDIVPKETRRARRAAKAGGRP